MSGYDVFADYLGLCEILFDSVKDTASVENTKLFAESKQSVHHLSVSLSLDSLISDNSGSLDVSNTSSSGSPQMNQPLELVPEISALLSSTSPSHITSSSPVTPPVSMTPPMVPLSALSPADVVHDRFMSSGSLDAMRVGRAISGRNLSSASETSIPGSDMNEMPDVCDFYTLRHQPNFDLTEMVHGMVKRACRKELVAAAEKFSQNKVCAFCQRNGETKEFYTTHVLKDSKGKVICPVLRSYVCPSCKATGDKAHTLRHCPLSHNISSMAETFKTRRTSCGLRKLNMQ